MTPEEIVALTIWWCEGAKLRKDFRWKNSFIYSIEITNTDPKIIKIFISFLKRKYHVSEKILKGQLQIHEGDDQLKLENFWSKETGIPISQFNKTIIRKNGTRKRKSFGTFKLRMYNKELFLKLKKLLDEMVELTVSGYGSVG